MKILIYSPLFYPSIGGLETVVSILAHEFFYQGQAVKLVSKTPATDSKHFPFEVIRQPRPQQLLQLTYWCDIYFQACVSLKGIWPLLVIQKNLVITHHTWYCRLDGTYGVQDYLKHFVSRFATNIAASRALAERISPFSTVVPNPYREDIFHKISGIAREQELVFLGRLVSDKGADLLLAALANLKSRELAPKLTIVGKGPEELQLRQQAKELDLVEQVNFAGVKVEQELVELLNSHQIMVVPSRWQEPFGVVALEGIACGCVVVGSEGGGLKDAIGNCGVTFPNGNVQALTEALAKLLTHPEQLSQYRENAASHLSRHQKANVAKAYLEVFQEAIA